MIQQIPQIGPSDLRSMSDPQSAKSACRNLCNRSIAFDKKNGAGTQTCTGDARFFRPALYYLSYPGVDARPSASLLHRRGHVRFPPHMINFASRNFIGIIGPGEKRCQLLTRISALLNFAQLHDTAHRCAKFNRSEFCPVIQPWHQHLDYVFV